MNTARRRGDTPASDHLSGDSQMSAALRAHDWGSSPLGPPATWPQSLKALTRVILSSGYPSFVWWGPELLNINNDAYLPVLGKKHPASIGTPAAQIWPEIWEIVGPLAQSVLDTGQAFLQERMQLFMNRKGYLEETYFTFSYSPATDDHGQVSGVYCTCFDDTAVVIGERRLMTLRTLATELVDAREVGAACERAIGALSANRNDLPFVALYLREPAGQGASGFRRMAMSGLPEGDSLCPPYLTAGHRFVAPTMQVVPISGQNETPQAVIANVPPEALVAIPLPAAPGAVSPGVLVVGISPCRALDEDYEGFLELIAQGVATGITTARTSEAERQRAAALAELDRAKTLFFSDVSHEFRTPLTLMLGPLQDVLGESEADLSRREVKLVYRNALRLLKLVNTLLDFARIEAGRAEALYEPVDIGTFTTDLASLFRSAMASAGLSFDVVCDPLDQPVYVDREMWEKIVLNLISNAIKFTFDGGISVTLKDAREHVELIVEDTGVGIGAADIPNLFKRFHRIRATRSRAHEGSGIGLALVDELVRLHQGSIEVESRTGEGSRFRVRVPKGKGHLPEDRIAPRMRSAPASGAALYVEETERWFAESDAEESADPDRPATDFLQPERPAHAPTIEKILLVDDNRDMREYLLSLLTDYDVHAVGDGQAALEAALSEPFSLVLTDVMLPGLDGLELTRALRAHPDLRETPVIMLSARAGESARVEGLEAGADIYLSKPFSARELLAHVTGQVRLAALRAEVTESYRRADERKDEFLAILGHELRNPLAALHSANELIEHGTADDRDYAHSVLSANITSLTRLVDDLLDVARLTRAKVTLRRERVRLAPLVRRLVKTDYEEMPEPRPTLRIDADESLEVDGDPVRLEQIVANLLTNSLRYTSAEGHIEIRVRRAADDATSAVLEVEDSGRGITGANLSKIFDPFWQPDGQTGRGLGVGLAIVKQLVALHDGSVHAHSDGPDRGSTFTVTLPVSGPTTAASAAPQTTNAADRPLQGRRVLLVDDNRDFVTGLTRLLEGLGAEVGVAYDGSSGLEAAAAQRWHLVFLDIGLPDVDGTEVARHIRTIPEGAPDRLVALTGYSDPATQQRIADAGFDEHLVKPVDTEILKRLISGE